MFTPNTKLNIIDRKTYAVRSILIVLVTVFAIWLCYNLYAEYTVRRAVQSIGEGFIREKTVGMTASQAVYFLQRHKFHVVSNGSTQSEYGGEVVGAYYVCEITPAGPFNHTVTAIMVLDSSSKVIRCYVHSDVYGI